MKILIFYDIIETNIRNKVIDILFDLGFKRVQFSVFLGEISKKKKKRLTEKLYSSIDKDRDSLYIFNLCEVDFKNCLFLGKIINKQFFNNDFIVF